MHAHTCGAQHPTQAKRSINICCCCCWGLIKVRFPSCDERFGTRARPFLSFFSFDVDDDTELAPNNLTPLEYFDGIIKNVFLVLSTAIVL